MKESRMISFELIYQVHYEEVRVYGIQDKWHIYVEID